ncbi:peptide chain release factor N(5)-glutamine methyltransferase [Galactobacter sp.]|uniref:peptide chain release factor N(5)-glutamine methyltransferase n=1 Tax=Galactobacter sp. TaxID=2676125 RepID=UPI0025BFA5F4|nr:peptide chain release factor N(5)-glutamine methyltransferase [Galactobacter sp.]
MSGHFVGLPEPSGSAATGAPMFDDALPAPVGIPASLGEAADLRAALRAATAALRAAHIESARNDAEVLAAHLLDVDRGRLAVMALMGEDVPAGYAELVAARAQRVPLQHLTGSAPFRQLELQVGPGVFVPRPETELVAGAAIDAARAVLGAGVERPLVVDLCTGSGAIAAAVATELPQAEVVAVELSDNALIWAARNLEATGVELLHGDARVVGNPGEVGEGLQTNVDVLISNPPYIPGTRHHADPEVGNHDPVEALYGGGADGMDLPAALIRQAALLLKPGGTLVMEHDETQGEAMRQATGTAQWSDVVVHQDLTGRDRFTTAVRTAAAADVGE